MSAVVASLADADCLFDDELSEPDELVAQYPCSECEQGACGEGVCIVCVGLCGFSVVPVVCVFVVSFCNGEVLCALSLEYAW